MLRAGPELFLLLVRKTSIKIVTATQNEYKEDKSNLQN